ncbi:MAG: ParB N-terminal domain-containing protein [Bacteroidales bacterium]|nr:ParB N-terminal domain-containing protein [Bacteroidales bacterium]
MAETKLVKISDLCPNEGQIPGVKKNPRCIKGEKFEKLCKSIADNPEMLDLRELLVYLHNGKYVCIGGNMRLEACKRLGYHEVPCKIIPQGTSVENLNAYVIKDNSGYGEWDWDMLANEWDEDLLEEWGLDFPHENEEDVGSTATAGASAAFTAEITFPDEDSLNRFRLEFEPQILAQIQNATITTTP